METAIMVLAGIFTVVMLILLPKYARFIHNQPKMHLDKKRQEEEELKAPGNPENHPQDGPGN